MSDDKQFTDLDDIPDDEIQEDLRLTKNELKDFRDELAILERNPVENKMKIYMLQPKIDERVSLIEKIEKLINFREERKNAS